MLNDTYLLQLTYFNPEWNGYNDKENLPLFSYLYLYA